MELEELKTVWASIDERLKKQEMLNKQIIQEMLYKKSDKSLNWLVNTDASSIIVSLLAIPFLIWAYNHPPFNHMLFPRIAFIVTFAICIWGIIWYYYKLKYLMRIDFSKIVKDNMFCMNKYSIMIKQEKISAYFLMPIIYILCILTYYEFKANLSLWVLLVVSLAVGVAITYWMYKKIYDKNIQSIKKNLQELEELKELDVPKE